MKTAGKVIVDF